MPLVIVTGYPCSGKTRRAEEVAKFMREKGSAVQVVNNESLGIVRNSAYKDSASEKPARAALKAAVERHLSGDSLMICDDLNYIKGFRYELYCMARALGTSCTTIHCDATVEQLCTFNQEAGRGGGEAGGRYEDWILEELPRRFERPNDRNRWERPLFVVRPEDGDLPFEGVM
ncbi:chromatin associated protein KTI12 [Baffinella frigidus]|nr:chromatin associated protein KTI12 [Cryptophyta sp. CCMP2293]